MFNLFRSPRGRLALIGGRLEYDNHAIFKALREASGGRIAVFATASEVPDEVGGEMVDDLHSHGIDAWQVPLTADNAASVALDPQLCQRVADTGSVYFTGGDQSRIIQALIHQGQETAMLSTLRRLHEAGGLVAGSSAGAAMMSRTIIRSGTSVEALTDGLVADVDQAGLTLGEGLGFFPWGVVDQHFIMRGRVGRLLVATHTAGYPFGFGVDENTAMLVEGHSFRVIGETGVVVLDLRDASIDTEHNEYRDVRLSYLDDGDSYDLRRHRPLPAADKTRLRVNRHSHTAPAPFRRNAFGSYALHELLIRLVRANPSHYRRDHLLAYDSRRETEVVVTLERTPRRSRALVAERDGLLRHTALNFLLHVRARNLTRRAWQDLRRFQRWPRAGAVLPQARLILLGNSPLKWDPALVGDLCNHLAGPVGILATASGSPSEVARDYARWLERHHIPAHDLNITSRNVDQRCRDSAFLQSLSQQRTILITGGDQRRLTETLLHRGDSTAVLEALLTAYRQGATLVAVGGAAAAVCSRMIAEGTSCEALRYGASEDASYEGVVIEEGLGLFEQGIVDQNFLDRQRLGRLLVACAEEGYRYGFGLCEESGMVVTGSGPIHAFGRYGFLVSSLDSDRLEMAPGGFSAQGVSLQFVQPGEAFDPASDSILDAGPTDPATSTVERLVAELARVCGSSLPPPQDAWLQLALTGGRPASLDIRSSRP